jgi:prepilin-type processing-associated H-X9-DG protein
MNRVWILLPLLAALVGGCGDDDEVESPRRSFDSDVMECAARMRAVYGALRELQAGEAWHPSAADAIPGDLVRLGAWPADDPRLACPASGAYAGRDCAAFPLERFPTKGTEPLLACPNADGPSHAGGDTNVLYADGSIRTLALPQEVERGRLPAGTTAIPVGPGSPLADLAKLRRP